MSPDSTLVVFLVLLASHFGCGGAEEGAPTSLTVFCASASKPAMEEIAERFERETGVQVDTIFGASGTLLSQIELSQKGEICVALLEPVIGVFAE